MKLGVHAVYGYHISTALYHSLEGGVYLPCTEKLCVQSLSVNILLPLRYFISTGVSSDRSCITACVAG